MLRAKEDSGYAEFTLMLEHAKESSNICNRGNSEENNLGGKGSKLQQICANGVQRGIGIEEVAHAENEIGKDTKNRVGNRGE